MNGTIASLATTITNPFGGGASFVAVLPPSLFRAGRNDVRVYMISGTPGAPKLATVTLAK